MRQEFEWRLCVFEFRGPNRLHTGGHQVWQLLKEETDALPPTGFMPVEAGFDNFEQRLPVIRTSCDSELSNRASTHARSDGEPLRLVWRR